MLLSVQETARVKIAIPLLFLFFTQKMEPTMKKTALIQASEKGSIN